MSTVRRGGGQWLEVKGGGGCLSLFGLPFFLAGLAWLAKSRGVLLKTRQGVIPFGAGLADDEICYLRALIERALAGNGGPAATHGG